MSEFSQQEFTESIRQGLNRWLTTATVNEIRPLAAGRSGQTYWLAISHGNGGREQATLRLHQPTSATPDPTPPSQLSELLEAVRSEGIPAPRPLWFCDDSSVVGAPFSIAMFIEGDVPNPWRRDGREALQRALSNGPLAQDYVEVLARIHNVSLSKIPDDLLREGDRASVDHPYRELKRWSAVVEGSEFFRQDPVLAYGREWLQTAERPTPPPPALVHSDYRPGNLVIRDGRLVGVLDWELAEVGDPTYDLGWACSPPGLTNGLAAGILPPDELVHSYESVTSCRVDTSNLDYHRVLATWKNACIWVNLSRYFDVDPDDAEAIRAGFSVLSLREMLATVLSLDLGGGWEGVSSNERVSQLAQSLSRVISRDVIPGIASERTEQQLRATLAFLRSLGARAAPAYIDQFSSDVAQLVITASECVNLKPKSSATNPFDDLHWLVNELYRERGSEVHYGSSSYLMELRRLVGIAADRRLGGTWI